MFTLSPVSIHIKFQSPRVGYLKTDSDFLHPFHLYYYYLLHRFRIHVLRCMYTLHLNNLWAFIPASTVSCFPVLLHLLVFSKRKQHILFLGQCAGTLSSTPTRCSSAWWTSTRAGRSSRRSVSTVHPPSYTSHQR